MSAPRPYATEPFRPLSSISNWYQFLYIQQHSNYLLDVVRSSVSSGGAYLTIAHALLQKHSYLWFRGVISLLFSIWYALVHTATKYMASAHVHLLPKQKSQKCEL